MALVGTPAARGVRGVAALMRGSYADIAAMQRRFAEEVVPRARGGRVV